MKRIGVFLAIVWFTRCGSMYSSIPSSDEVEQKVNKCIFAFSTKELENGWRETTAKTPENHCGLERFSFRINSVSEIEYIIPNVPSKPIDFSKPEKGLLTTFIGFGVPSSNPDKKFYHKGPFQAFYTVENIRLIGIFGGSGEPIRTSTPKEVTFP